MKSNIVILAENAINWNNMAEFKALIQRQADISDRTGIKIISKGQLFGKEQIVNKEHYEYCMDRRLAFKEAEALFQFGSDIGQKVFYTCTAPKFVKWCEVIGVEYYKVRFYDRLNLDIRKAIQDTTKPYFMSKGMSMCKNSPNEIDLFCVPHYPADIKEYLKDIYTFSSMKGISCHTSDTKLLQIAQILGVEYFEQHVCMTREGCLERDWAITLQELEAALEVSHVD